MFKKALPIVLLFAGFNANAAIVAGESSDNYKSGDLYTFIFDYPQIADGNGGFNHGSTRSDISGTGMGMSFLNNGLSLHATGSARVYQDMDVKHGGLGVNPTSGSNPGGDNLSGNEWLNFDIGGASFDLVNISLNGGHSDCIADQVAVDVTTNHRINGFGMDGRYMDGCPGPSNDFGDFDVIWSDVFTNITYFSVDDFRNGSGVNATNYNPFSGYVESITIRASTSVPEPSIIVLMSLGIIGLGISRRKIKR